MAHPEDDRASPEAEDPQSRSPEERRRRFAAAITKAEFGRFYWDDELERRLRGALGRRSGKRDGGPPGK
jgi:hypothetical protein